MIMRVQCIKCNHKQKFKDKKKTFFCSVCGNKEYKKDTLKRKK